MIPVVWPVDGCPGMGLEVRMLETCFKFPNAFLFCKQLINTVCHRSVSLRTLTSVSLDEGQSDLYLILPETLQEDCQTSDTHKIVKI